MLLTVHSGRGSVTGVTELTLSRSPRAAVNSGRGAGVLLGLLSPGVCRQDRWSVTVCTGIVEFPSAGAAVMPQQNFASRTASFWPSHWPAPSNHRYRMWWRYTQIPYWFSTAESNKVPSRGIKKVSLSSPFSSQFTNPSS
nr:hypothetical protein [Escherichia coli]